MSPSNEAVLLLTPGNGVNRTIQDMGRLEQDRAVLPALDTKGALRLRILMTVTKKNKSEPMELDKTLVALLFFKSSKRCHVSNGFYSLLSSLEITTLPPATFRGASAKTSFHLVGTSEISCFHGPFRDDCLGSCFRDASANSVSTLTVCFVGSP